MLAEHLGHRRQPQLEAHDCKQQTSIHVACLQSYICRLGGLSEAYGVVCQCPYKGIDVSFAEQMERCCLVPISASR